MGKILYPCCAGDIAISGRPTSSTVCLTVQYNCSSVFLFCEWSLLYTLENVMSKKCDFPDVYDATLMYINHTEQSSSQEPSSACLYQGGNQLVKL